MTVTDEDLDLRLARADRSSDVKVGDEVAGRLLRATRERSVRTRRIRLTFAAILVTFTVTGAVVAGPATADAVRHFLAQSSWHPQAGGEVLPDSEWVNLDAPDLPAYVASRWEKFLPLAPGQTRQSVIDDAIKSSSGETGVTQEVGFRADMEETVYGAWICEWISADDAKDPARITAAANVIAQVPTWPAYAATDGGAGTDSIRLFSHGISAGDREYAEAAAEQEHLACWDGVSRRDLIDEVFVKAHAIWDAATGTNQ